MLVDWNELEVTDTRRMIDVAAQNVNAIDVLWNASYGQSGTDYSAIAEDTQFITPDFPRWVSWDIKDLTQAWIDGAATNYGVMLLAINEDVDGFDLRFRSSDYTADMQFRPKLEIRWTLATRTTYFLKDHLGTTRAAITDAGDVVGYDDYDPWGLVLKKRSMTSQPNMPFKYTGKEWDDDNGLDWYYFGARYYDPVVGRWHGVDPFDFKYPSWSSYNYTLDNPIAFIDPDGRGVTSKIVKTAARVHRKKLFNAARRKAVREAWKQEKQQLIDVGKTTMELSVKEKSELLESGKVKGWFGHHSNSVAHHSLEMAADPTNIKFVKGVKGHLTEHGGNFKNKTTGPLIERISKMSGPAMLTFFLTYERVLNNILSQGSIYSSDDSWLSLINPFNSAVEIVALTEAIAAANATEQKTKKGGGGSDIINPSVINGPGDSGLIQLESGGL